MSWSEIVLRSHRRLLVEGGPGSGYEDHPGRPGLVGGSAPMGGGSNSKGNSKNLAKQNKTNTTSILKKINSIDFPAFEKAVSSGTYSDFVTAKDKSSFILKRNERLAKSLGIDFKTKIVSDGEFNDLFKNAKISDFGRLMSGVNAISAGYTSNDNTIWLRKTAVANLKSSNDYRLFLNRVEHEIGHAYHSNALGITRQDKGEYGSGWCERFAEMFSETTSAVRWRDSILKNHKPEERLFQTWKKFNFKTSFLGRIKDLD